MKVIAFIEKFCRRRLFPLLGFTQKQINGLEFRLSEKKGGQIIQFHDDGFVFDFYDDSFQTIELGKEYENQCLKIDPKVKLDDEAKGLIANIFDVFHDVLIANIALFSTKIFINVSKRMAAATSNKESFYENSIFDYVVQKGIIRWIVTSNKTSENKLEELFEILNRWSLKTYEGHKVCFGFILTPDGTSNGTDLSSEYSYDLFKFLDDEYSATITDGMTSVLKITYQGKFIDYLSYVQKDAIEGCEFNNLVLPYRFSVIMRKVEGQDVGVFLLQSGDLILVKNAEIYFVKRNGRWLNFKYSAFRTALANHLPDGYVEDSLLRDIFVTAIDVSLSHTGGIIACVDREKIEHGVITDIDDLSNGQCLEHLYAGEMRKRLVDCKFDFALKHDSDSDFSNTIRHFSNALKDESKETIGSEEKKDFEDFKEKAVEYSKNNAEVKKRLTKRNFVLTILGKRSHFSELGKRLKTELIGMDGATLIDRKGKIISFGAIIRNEAGSSGGGRGAAARLLSKYGGFSVKISTDGYIEVYVNQENVYQIK